MVFYVCLSHAVPLPGLYNMVHISYKHDDLVVLLLPLKSSHAEVVYPHLCAESSSTATNHPCRSEGSLYAVYIRLLHSTS